MWKNVEDIAKIEIKVKASDQIGNGRFKFDETMLGRV
jgi:hypothetical protein